MRSTLGLIFFHSGASALIFESLWFRGAGLAGTQSIEPPTLGDEHVADAVDRH